MSDIFGILVLFAPLFVIIWVANLAERSRRQGESYQGLAILSYVLVILLYGMAFLVGVGLQFAFVMVEQQPTVLNDLGLELPDTAILQDVESLGLLSTGVWISALVSMLLLTPPARRLFAQFTNIDPKSPVHAVALSFMGLVAINLAVTLGIGLANLTTLLEAQAETLGENGQNGTGTILTLWAQQIATALLALVGVGWAVRRDWSTSLERLGIVKPSRQQVLIGFAVGLAMVPAVMLLELALNSLFGIGVDPDVEELTEQLLGPLFNSPFGILTLGLAAALGEETIFRGALQPRFGLILTALLFAVVHSNYGITISTLVVFLLGLVLGYVRMRHNTSTTMIVHAVYNITLGLLAYLSLNFLDNF
jgi:membrane protease YdiL (CAAX protease family)